MHDDRRDACDACEEEMLVKYQDDRRDACEVSRFKILSASRPVAVSTQAKKQKRILPVINFGPQHKKQQHKNKNQKKKK
jgi:hypothetical protein